ncbi:hypothetical protein FGG08_000466 [Glutinoglossum americanum]|uniref:NB-ARC domain-containing protein n=1 Tax=Glutinoglossum americanum TaxID=1670608 RepID=A0A9P8ID56_9PEZI|nr:hypothetical protein FGG08_000466 [Glutinoglossum americanum]
MEVLKRQLPYKCPSLALIGYCLGEMSRVQSLGETEPPAPPQGYPPQSSTKHSQIWQNAIQRYYDELGKGGIRGPAIEKDLWGIKSPVELLDQIKDLEPSDSRSSGAWVGSLRRLETVLLSLNDFAAVTAWALGMNGRVGAVVWGSIRLILNLAKPVLPEVLDMLEELRRTLPRYRTYEQELRMTESLEDALSDMYAEIIVFCARAITFFQNNPNVGRSRNAWSEFNSQFLKTIGNLRNYSRRVDEEADIIRMTREANSAEMVDVMKKLNDVKLSGGNIELPCHMIPYGLNPRFFSRAKEAAKVKEILDPRDGEDKLRVMAIYGLGGVGKTQLALHYANTSLKLYDIIAWIPSETQIKMTQALSAFARKLGLPIKDDPGEDFQASLKVRDWLNTSGRRFLLIFDNVDTIDLLLQVWPASDKGSILITTRSLSMASRHATDIMNLESFTTETGLEALYSLTGARPTADGDSALAAKDICRLLGGLPLALVQISEFIRDRSYSYEEFLPIYQSSAAKVLARGKTPIEYNHTLSTVWDLSLQKLPQESKILQNLIAFFDPDRIEERLLTNPKAGPLGASTSPNCCLLWSLGEEMGFYLDSVITILSNGFPNTWKKAGHQQGHGWASWETCSEVLPHVNWLMDLSKKHKLKAGNPELFAELIFRSGAYLWEREQPTAARSFFIYGLSLGVNRGGPTCNPAIRLLGHVALDMAQPEAALKAYYETLAARLELVESDSPEIANVYDSIACSYTEMNNVEQAFEYLEKAMRIHDAKGPQGRARTCAILAMTHLRARNPDQALEALKECWQLQNLTEDQIADSKYPKHSGDIVLLSRIQYAKGNKESALQLASRSINIRKGILGNKGPRVADSMFLVSSMLRDNQKDALAAKLLREVVDMSQGIVDMEGHLARALWALGGMEEEVGNWGEGEELRKRARAAREGIEGREGGDEDSDEGFGRLVGYMLW